jgi:hypothetical protein
MSNEPSFFAELKRRNVVRMAGLYLVGAVADRTGGGHVVADVGAGRRSIEMSV